MQTSSGVLVVNSAVTPLRLVPLVFWTLSVRLTVSRVSAKPSWSPLSSKVISRIATPPARSEVGAARSAPRIRVIAFA